MRKAVLEGWNFNVQKTGKVQEVKMTETKSVSGGRKANILCVAVLTVLAPLTGAAETYETNTVEGLVYLLTTYNGKNASNVIKLAPGDYNLGSTRMSDHATLGPSQLFVSTIRVRGAGATCEATRLIGSGECRVIYGTSSATLENLTVTGGNAKTVSGKGSSNRGGALYADSSSVVATNCLFVGNKAQGYGGVFGGASTARDCRIVGNSCAGFGGAAHGGYFYNCVFSNNVASSEGGAGYNVNRIDSCHIISNSAASCGAVAMCTLTTNSLIACNYAKNNTGGLYLYVNDTYTSYNTCVDCVISNNACGGDKGGVYGREKDGQTALGLVRGCVIVGNTAGNSAGGVYNCLCIDTLISNNVAKARAGGSAGVYRNCRIVGNRSTAGTSGVQSGELYDSTVSHNRAVGDDCAALRSCTISNCLVFANSSFCDTANCYGPAIRNSTAYDSEIFANSCEAANGKAGCAGGSNDSTLYRCYVHDNYSSHYGGGVRGGAAYDCRIENNVAPGIGPNAMGAVLVRCDVSGTGVFGGRATDTTFHDVGGTVTVKGNPAGEKSLVVKYVWSGYPSGTNCLIHGNRMPRTDSAVFTSADAVAAPSFVNCTIVSNLCENMFSGYSTLDSTKRMSFVNCLFYGNEDHNSGSPVPCDIFGTAFGAGGLNFTRTAYGAASYSGFSDCVTQPVYKFGAEDGVGQVIAKTPRFCYGKDPENPYALLHSSKVRGLGVYQAWMASANDIRGEDFPRADGTSVDLGCYQCWRPADGMMLLFR